MGELAKSKSGSAAVALAISGMSCAGCVDAVKRLLSNVPGVAEVDVDLGSGRALVSGTPSAEDLVASLQGTGYAARPA